MAGLNMASSLLGCSLLLLLVGGASAQATYPSEFTLSFCYGEDCVEQQISCAQFQLRAWEFYTGVRGGPHPSVAGKTVADVEASQAGPEWEQRKRDARRRLPPLEDDRDARYTDPASPEHKLTRFALTYDKFHSLWRVEMPQDGTISRDSANWTSTMVELFDKAGTLRELVGDDEFFQRVTNAQLRTRWGSGKADWLVREQQFPEDTSVPLRGAGELEEEAHVNSDMTGRQSYRTWFSRVHPVHEVGRVFGSPEPSRGAIATTAPRAPLREAMFLASLPREYVWDLTEQCPGCVVTAHLIVAEAFATAVGPGLARKFLNTARAMIGEDRFATFSYGDTHSDAPFHAGVFRDIPGAGPGPRLADLALLGQALPAPMTKLHRNVMMGSWPIDLALDRAIAAVVSPALSVGPDTTVGFHAGSLRLPVGEMHLEKQRCAAEHAADHARLEQACTDEIVATRALDAAAGFVNGRPPVLDVVICRCREKLEWLYHLPWPASGVRLFIYEKCLSLGNDGPDGEPNPVLGADPDGNPELAFRLAERDDIIRETIGRIRRVEYVVIVDHLDILTGRRQRRDECAAYALHTARATGVWEHSVHLEVEHAARGEREGFPRELNDDSSFFIEHWRPSPISEVPPTSSLPGGAPALWTAFLHGEPDEHTKQLGKWAYLRQVLRSLEFAPSESIAFLHLSSPRLVSVSHSCQMDVFENVMEISMPKHMLLATYCCAQFLVRRDRLLGGPWAERGRPESPGSQEVMNVEDPFGRVRFRRAVRRLLRIVDGTLPDLCSRVGPSYEAYAGERLSYCYNLEFAWHAIFGEPVWQPLRTDDARLPLLLRVKENNDAFPSLAGKQYPGAMSGEATVIVPIALNIDEDGTETVVMSGLHMLQAEDVNHQEATSAPGSSSSAPVQCRSKNTKWGWTKGRKAISRPSLQWTRKRASKGRMRS